MLYGDDQPACLVAAYEHGDDKTEMLTLLRPHIVERAHCGCNAATVQTDRLYVNPVVVYCEVSQAA